LDGGLVPRLGVRVGDGAAGVGGEATVGCQVREAAPTEVVDAVGSLGVVVVAGDVVVGVEDGLDPGAVEREREDLADAPLVPAERVVEVEEDGCRRRRRSSVGTASGGVINDWPELEAVFR
ncbi:hypothetical protein, partial [Haloarchaeobius iranensis]|uniref:hypothetical protein n=1 Tax=Haloarchaeobius iranensis TaxID=996166 RepID=UPI00363B9583